MTGIIIAGAGIGQLVAPPIVSRLIRSYDWHQTFLILGSVISIAVILAAQFLRRDPAKMKQVPYGMDEVKQQVGQSDTNDLDFREAVYTAQFWLAFAILFCVGFNLNSIMVHIVPHAIDLDIADINAANILSFMGGANIAGNYILGSAADRIGNRRVIVLSFVIIMASLFWIMLASKLWMFYLFAIAFGFSCGGIGAIESPLVAGLFGLSSHGVIYGVIHVGFTVGAAIGPLLTAHIYDLTDSYQVAFLTCAAVGIVGIILAIVLRPIKRLGGSI
jgi:OFA family oxalate/formate antiporter-like MFS transporter